MLKLASALKGYAIEASDGEIGTVADFLFDDRSWLVRWLVVETGSWLAGRRVLLHPTAIVRADHERRELSVSMTRAQIQGSPELSEHEPVSMQMEHHLYDYYGWEPISLQSAFSANPIASRFSAPPLFVFPPHAKGDILPTDGDPRLRSVNAVIDYHIHATDGGIGKVGDLLVDDALWDLPALVVDAGNWWSGKQVLISHLVVKDISWADREIRIDLDRQQVKACPPWNSRADVELDHAAIVGDRNAQSGHSRPA